ncbi:MAG: transposase [Peptostreptococcaceae bacterium]|nr:transposase [Peptostreptococcaceae bacterium]
MFLFRFDQYFGNEYRDQPPGRIRIYPWAHLPAPGNPCQAGYHGPILSIIYNGSRHDSTTVRNLIDALKKLDLKSICITLDKEYYSEDNLQIFFSEGYDFIICMPGDSPGSTRSLIR